MIRLFLSNSSGNGQSRPLDDLSTRIDFQSDQSVLRSNDPEKGQNGAKRVQKKDAGLHWRSVEPIEDAAEGERGMWATSPDKAACITSSSTESQVQSPLQPPGGDC